MKTPGSVRLLLLSSLFSLFLCLCHASSSLAEGRDRHRDSDRDSGRDNDAQVSPPVLSPAELVVMFPRTLAIDPVLGLVKRCSKCGEWWTASRLFFGSAPDDHQGLGLHSHCQACTAERGHRRRGEVGYGLVTR